MRLLLLLPSLSLLACSQSTLLLSADAERAGALGDDGAFGALLIERTFRVRGDRAIDVDVVVPADDNGNVAAGGFAPVLLVQGGLAAVERYHWLAQHMASRGFAVVAPHHVADLAFFSQGDGLDALAAFRRASDRDGEGNTDDLGGVVNDVPALAIGQSLGGVVASNAFAGDEAGVSHLVLLSSVPNPGVDVSRTTGRMLTVAGEDDGKISVDEVRAGAEEFACDKSVGVVAGLTHYALTDDPSDSELAGDGKSDVPVAEARRRTLVLVDAMLLSLDGDKDGDILLDNPTTWPAGVKP